MIIKWRTAIGLALSILVFTSTIPLLMSVESTPQDVFEGPNVVVMSTIDANKPINSSAVSLIRGLNYTVSPEIFLFSVVNGMPVTVRGVDVVSFLRVEGASMLEGQASGSDFLLIGSSFQKRSGLTVGDKMVIPGSARASIYEGTITGVFRSDTPADDEILVPLDIAREMAGKREGTYQVVRVLNGNITAIADALRSQNYTVAVGSGPHVATTNTNQTYEETVAVNLMLRYSDEATFKLTNASHMGLFAQRASSSVKVAVLGFIGLDASLTFIGSFSILSRAIFDRRRDIGILRAIGAGKMKIRLIILKEAVLLSSVAASAALIAGYLVVSYASSSGLIVAFGQTMRPSLSSFTFVWMFAVMVLVSSISGLFVVESILRISPSRLIAGFEVQRTEGEQPEMAEALGVDI